MVYVNSNRNIYVFIQPKIGQNDDTELLNNGKPSMFKDISNTLLKLHFIVMIYCFMVFNKIKLMV